MAVSALRAACAVQVEKQVDAHIRITPDKSHIQRVD